MRAMTRRAPETRLRQQLVQFGHLCYERRLLVGLDGNLSVRLTDALVLATRAGVHKGLMTADDLVVVDLAGHRVRGQGQPTSELAMHLACYRERPDVEAVVHAHPPTAVAFTIAGLTLARCVLPEVVLTLGTVPTLPYSTTGTADLAEQVAAAARRHDALLLDRHGAVCLGTSLEDAFCKLETLEHLAMIMKAARDLGGVQDLPADESERLRRMGLLRYGGPPAAVALAHAPMADLPEACGACSGCGRPSADGLAAPAGFSVARLTRA
ncbi:MAG: class II aldolase family protein [Deltaproteobacteria bacterium HGW-Deltaproteobacteria-14]|jgi:L-fuculose-phosphate aldolase|nr:MAG: class II aldolase family protein [Deltaproteobacteria bacterium HGW-Deltaproteobacteria-14]